MWTLLAPIILAVTVHAGLAVGLFLWARWALPAKALYAISVLVSAVGSLMRPRSAG